MEIHILIFATLLSLGLCEDCSDADNALDCIMKNNGMKSDDTYSEDIGVKLYEGDIVYTDKLKSQIGEMRARYEAGLQPFDAIRNGQWPSGIVPYTFARGFSYRSVVEQAIGEYNKKTCVRFKPYTATNARAAGGYVEFMHGGGCYSMIGRQRGKQQISLGRGCGHIGVAVHEMMHALGWFHEQSRRDRDSYITINWRNINRAMYYNFEKYRQGQASTLNEPYDKRSVMHYGNYAFSINGQKTIVSRANPNERLGQRSGLSVIDVNQLNKYYKCGKPVTTSKPSGKCNDDYVFCRVLSSYCSNNWVKTNCKLTCKRCSSSCKDNNNNCTGWSRKGYCGDSRYKTYMSKNCKKSCKLC